MFKTKFKLVLAIAVCGLLLTTTGIAKKQVERPMKFKGTGIVMVDWDPSHWTLLPDGTVVVPWETKEWGTSTHMGNWEATTIGSTLIGFLPPDGTPQELAQWSEAEWTAANGDKILAAGTKPDVSIGTQLTTIFAIHGGTGRFENATGTGTWVGEYTGEEWWEGSTQFSVVIGSAEGTIKY